MTSKTFTDVDISKFPPVKTQYNNPFGLVYQGAITEMQRAK